MKTFILCVEWHSTIGSHRTTYLDIFETRAEAKAWVNAHPDRRTVIGAGTFGWPAVYEERGPFTETGAQIKAREGSK